MITGMMDVPATCTECRGNDGCRGMVCPEGLDRQQLRFNTIFTLLYYDVPMLQEPLNIEDLAGMLEDQRVLRLSGPILISNLFQFQALVRANTLRSLILDLTQVPYIDSAGIGALVGAYVNHQKDGRRLALVGVVERVRNTMQVTRVEQFFQFYDTPQAAEAALAKR